MCFKAGPSRAEAHSLNVNGGKMWCGRWLSSFTCATRGCCSTCRLLHSKISVHRSGQGLHCPASQMLCPTSSPVPDTSQGQERSSPPFFCHRQVSGSMLHAGTQPHCSPCMRHSPTLGARSGAELFPALLLLEQPLQPGSAPNSCSSPRTWPTFHFKIYLLPAFNLLRPYGHSVHLPCLTMSFEGSWIILKHYFLRCFSHLCREAVQILTSPSETFFHSGWPFFKGPFEEKKKTF